MLKYDAFREISWKHVVVGDIIEVSQNSPLPADAVLLTSSEPMGVCYIDTATLDGETNFKVRQALHETVAVQNEETLVNFEATIETGRPEKALYEFHGNLVLQPSGEKGRNATKLSTFQATLLNFDVAKRNII